MKLRKFFIIFLLAFFTSPSYVFADEFKNISIDVNLDENGIGYIKEVWQIDETNLDYTERYKLINNLSGLKIEDFSLNAFGKDFTELSPWDIDASFEDKAYHYGRIDRDDEVELTWGISQFSSNTYNLSYKINPLVVGLNDSDMLFFNFVGENFNPKPQNVNIKISGFKPFDDVKMWGFGLIGDIHNINGDIVLKSTGDIKYTTIMLKFPKGYFNTSYKIDKDFSDYANSAYKGSDWEQREGEAYKKSISKNQKTFFTFLTFAIIGVLFFIAKGISLSFNKKNIVNKKELIQAYKLAGKYYKDIPYDGHVEEIAFFIKEAKLSPYDLVGNYINSFILKWYLDKNILFSDEKIGFLSEKKITILSKPDNMGIMEEKIFDMIFAANEMTDTDYVTDNDFKKYLKKNRAEMDNFYSEFEEESIKALISKGYMENYKYEKSFLNFKKSGTELKVTEKGIELYKNMIMFRNYIDDFDGVGEFNENSSKSLRDLFVYSSVFFLDEDFANDLSVFPYYLNHCMIHRHTINNSRAISKSINQTYGNVTGFSNAGFGGATSFGGGGGSFGGGGGGGR